MSTLSCSRENANHKIYYLHFTELAQHSLFITNLYHNLAKLRTLDDFINKFVSAVDILARCICTD